MSSPGPQWATLQEPSTSSADDETDLDVYQMGSTTLKRKGNTSVSQSTPKRPKLAPEPFGRGRALGEGSRAEIRETSNSSRQGKPKSVPPPAGRVSSVPSSSKPVNGKGVGASNQAGVASGQPRQSLLKFRSAGASSVTKTKVVQRRPRKEKSSDESGMDATSPPASPSPPPQPSTRPKVVHASTMPENKRQLHGVDNPGKSTTNLQTQTVRPRSSVSTSVDVIEISSSSDDSPPKQKVPPSKLSKPLASKRRSLPIIPNEVIVLDDSDEESPVSSSRSSVPPLERSISDLTKGVTRPATPPAAKRSPLSKEAESRLLDDRFPSTLRIGHPPKVTHEDDMIVDDPSPSNPFQSRNPKNPSRKTLSVDLRRLSGITHSPRKSKAGINSAPNSPLASTIVPKLTFLSKPSSLRSSSSSNVDNSPDGLTRPDTTRKDSLDLDMRSLKVTDGVPSVSQPSLSTRDSGSSGTSDRQNSGKTKTSLSFSSPSLGQTSAASNDATSSTVSGKATKRNVKLTRLEGATSSASTGTRPAFSRPSQTLAGAITQASELNARKGSSKQDAIDLTSESPPEMDLQENLDAAFASSHALQSLIESGDLGNLLEPSATAAPQTDSLQPETQLPKQRRTNLTSKVTVKPRASHPSSVNSTSPTPLEINNISPVPQVPTASTPASKPAEPSMPHSVQSLSPAPALPPSAHSPQKTLVQKSTSPTSPSPRRGANFTLATLPEKELFNDEPEYSDGPFPANQSSDSDEMDTTDLCTAVPTPKAGPSSRSPRTQPSDDEAEELVEAASSLAVVSTTGSSPDPLDMGVSSSPEQKILSLESSFDELRHSSRRSSASSNDPISLFDEDDIETPPKTRSSSPYDSSKFVATKTFGGFPSLNWKTYRQDVNNFTQKCYLAKDLPHSLQDHINCWSPLGQRLPGLRTVLECYIQENTADDEPDAPLIEIINDVDDDPTPPWEFHYSNKMWHGEGVPPPDVVQLTSCGCTGKCDPKSKTCACLKRQQQYTGEADFAFDGKGRLKFLDYPIFECNDLCGCGEDCRNRVVQHGRKCGVNIKKTEEKGWGVFAGPKKIYQGSFIGIYAGELLTDAVGEERGINYNKFGRTYLFDLDFHHLKEGKDSWDVKYTVDAYHAGNFTRFLNHSCDPNCRLVPCYINESNLDKPLLTVFARRDIEPFEELCFSYSGEYPEDDDELDPRSSPSVFDREDQAVYAKCACRAKNCTGVMFK